MTPPRRSKLYILRELEAQHVRLLDRIKTQALLGYPTGDLEKTLWQSRGEAQALRDHILGAPLDLPAAPERKP